MKKFVLFFVLALSVFLLASCKEKDIVFEFSGVENKTIEFDANFNILEGVKVMGNDKVDYTNKIKYTTLGEYDKTTHKLDTRISGSVMIKYIVDFKIGDKSYYADAIRTITVKAPEKTGFLLNGDFSQGVVGWVKYADGGTIDLTEDNGMLKAIVKAGGQFHDPRFSQMNVPFEQDKTYEISFKAKASKAGKVVNLQVGELLSADPWFTDFKPRQTEHRELTTELVTYSYKFTHKLDNKRGGILFELGTTIDATIWFDDIQIKEATADPDTAGPLFENTPETRNISVGSDYDPLAGVTAYDLVDGDVTEDIEIKIYLVEEAVETLVEEIDTANPAEYKVVYKVTDASGNTTTVTQTLTISNILFEDDNLVVDGDFAKGNTQEKWYKWDNDAGLTIDYSNEEVSINVTNGGAANYSVQFNQEGIKLQKGSTYRLTFDAKATVARDINVVIATVYQEGVESRDYNRYNGFELVAEYKTYEFLFTVQDDSSDNLKLSFELGNTTKFAAGTVSIDNVSLQKAIVDEVLNNAEFAPIGWRTFTQNGPTSTIKFENGVARFDFTNTHLIQNDWDIQVIQDKFALGTGPDNTPHIKLVKGSIYKLTFKARASMTGDVTLQMSTVDYANYAGPNTNVTITETMQEFVLDFTVANDVDDAKLVMFKIQFNRLFGTSEDPQFFELSEVKLEVKEGETYTDTNMIQNGTMESAFGWSFDPSGDSNANGTIKTKDGKLVVNVTGIGANAYTPHLHNGVTTTMTIGKYVFEAKVSTSVLRTIRFNIVDVQSGYSSILANGSVDHTFKEVDAVETVRFEVNLTVDKYDRLKLEIDFGKLTEDGVGSVPAEITFHEIYLYKVY